jgi:nitrite reductase/ring-hydroxylating ferredoxin subunit
MLNPEIVANRRPIDRLSRNAPLRALAERVQPLVTRLLAGVGRPVQDVLHGTILGHPLHAVVTDVPVGAWTVTAVLDTVELAGGPATAGGDAALIIGLAGGFAAAASGWADWSDTHAEPRTLGMAHAIVNGAALLGYGVSLALRRTGQRQAGMLTGLAAYGIVAAGAYLGGELSFGLLLGAKHTAAPLAPPTDFTPVARLDDLPMEGPLRAEVAGIPLLIARLPSGGVAAISAICTHRGAPLDEGSFADGCVTCPWHASRFALADGRVIAGPAVFPQARFDARINGDSVEVRAFDPVASTGPSIKTP